MATISITIPDELLPTFQRFQQDNGVEWADGFIVDKLNQLATSYKRADADTLYQQYQTLPTDQQAQIAASLATLTTIKA